MTSSSLLNVYNHLAPKFIVANAIIVTKLMGTEFFSATTLFNDELKETNMLHVGLFGDIDLFTNPMISNDDNRILIGVNLDSDDIKNCITVPVNY